MGLDVGISFVACSAAIAALVPGYVVWLRLGRGGTKPNADSSARRSARVDVIVAVRDEAEWIEDKLDDLAALDPPDGGLAFWIVDGASGDDTAARAERRADADSRFHALRTNHRKKIDQLDAALARCDAEWVLATDADARLPSDVVRAMLDVAARDPSIGVVGVPVEPVDAHPVERLHWRSLNATCRAESRRGSAATVFGPCMLFRRSILPDGFPRDVVADDVHVAFAAAAAGFRVAFVDRTVRELRAPRTLGALVRHKIRKGDAFLREIARFLPRVREFPRPARGVFLWRAAQAFVFPFAALGAAASGVAWTVSAGPATAAWAAAAACAALVADFVFTRSRLLVAAALGALLAATLLAALVGLPFARLRPLYRKVPTPHPTRGEPAAAP